MFSHAGELRWKCNLLEPRLHRRKPSGYVAAEWRAWAEAVWCKIEEGVGSESQAHDQRDAGMPILVTVRYALPRLVTPLDVVELLDGSGRVCNVVAVKDPDQLRRQLEIYCRAPA